MKKQRWFSILLAMVLLVTAVPAVNASAESQMDVTMNMQYGQSEARKMVQEINAFRTGSDAWAWDENNVGKEQYTDLSALTYDYNLERIAMQRAAEIALNFSHKRPNGQNCYTVDYNGTKSLAESIAAGSSSAHDTFVQLRQDGAGYSGQEYRRNMLNPQYGAVGIAHVAVNGHHFWVQEFGAVNSGAGETTALNGFKQMKIAVSSAMMRMGGIQVPPKISLAAGQEIVAPGATVYYRLPDTPDCWDLLTMEVTPQWSSADSRIVQIKGRNIAGAADGTAQITAQVMGFDVSVTVNVGRSDAPQGKWVKKDGGWQFLVDGKPLRGGWAKDSGGWCYLKSDGYMLTNGWVEDSRGWCYMDSTGHQMKDRWQKDRGGWCYLKPDGYMMTNTWVQDSHGWYYMDSTGHQAKNRWQKDGGGWCYLKSDGYMMTNDWVKDSHGWCYMDSTGHRMKNQWQKDRGGWCYLKSDGYMMTNTWVQDSDGWYYMDSTGHQAKNRWQKDRGGWCYLDDTGYMLTNGLAKDSHGWCYLGANGHMVKNKTVKTSQGTYVLDEDGYVTNL